MDCDKARDRFSSLWEKELMPSEEKILKEHLSSCSECRREFEQFEKTMGWLHSVGEAEVPEGFLSEIHKKREEKKGAIPFEKFGGRWPHFPRSFKLPAQAVAMMAVVFLVLYLTKMMPPPPPEPSDGLKAPSSTEGVGSKAGAISGGKGEERRSDSTVSEPSPSARQAYRPEQSRVAGIPAPQSEVMAHQNLTEPKGAGRDQSPSPEPGKIKKELAAQEKSFAASKPPHEITLKVPERKKVIPRLHELVKQFGGEVVAAEGDMFLASLPAGSFPEFEKELAGFRSPAEADRLIVKKDTEGSLRLKEEAKRREGDERSKGLAGLGAGTGSRTIVRILLVEE